MFRSNEPEEIIIHASIIVYAAMFMVFALGMTMMHIEFFLV